MEFLYRSITETNLDISVSYNILNPFNNVWIADSRGRRIDAYGAINDAQDPLFSPGNTSNFIECPRSIQTLLLNITLIFQI